MDRPRSARLWFLVAGLWLALGYANLARGAPHALAHYRRWAFDHHSYSDVWAMAGDRYFHGGRPTPYLGDRIEYPPLLGAALWLPSYAPGGPLGYFTASYLFLAACGLACVALLARLPGARVAWLAASPALLYYGGLNWDLFPIALLLGAVVAFERRRVAPAGALTALGASAKLWPVALLPGALGALAGRRDLRAAARGSAAFTGTWLAVNLPVAVAAFSNWSWFWRFNAGRRAENSAWELLRLSRRLAPLTFDARFLDLVTLGVVAAAALLALWAAWRTSADAASMDRAVRLGTALVVAAWITVNKVWSPQYALWACAAGALAAAPTWLLVAHALLAPIDYHVAFEYRASRQLIRFLGPLYAGEELVRTALYVALVAFIAAALWRLGRRAGTERAA